MVETIVDDAEVNTPTAATEDASPEAAEETPKDPETATDVTADSAAEEKISTPEGSTPIVSSSKKSRPPYKFDPAKITLRFLFANRDGLTVTLECDPADTVGEVKGALMSVWPEDMPSCDGGGENLRLICMGKGFLAPDTRTLDACQIPVFKTHPTPINVSIKPEVKNVEDSKKKNTDSTGSNGGGRTADASANVAQTSQGCGCTIL